MKEINMKYAIIIIISIFFISCNDVHLADPEKADGINVISVKIEPPVALPGEKVVISADISNGTADAGTANISAGNMVFTASDKAELQIPSDISVLFGDSARKKLTSEGFVDIPITLTLPLTGKSAVKYFRIAGNDYEKTKFDINPAINSMTYEIIGSAQKLPLERDSWLYIKPLSVPEQIGFEVSELLLDDLVLDDYSFSWTVTGDAETYPEIVESNDQTGYALFSFIDKSGFPVFGDYRFHLVISPKKSFQGTRSARYGTDFFTFVISTKGEPLEEEDADNETAD